GTIAKTGGKVVKNVAGYDLHKLMTGAFGTLGVITEVTFRLHSVARHARSFTVSAGDAELLGRLMMMVMDSHLNAQSLQMRSGDAGFQLDVRLAALPEVMEEQGKALGAMAAGLGLAAGDGDEGVWGAREGMFAGTAVAVVKATMLPTEIAPMTVTVAKLGGRSVAQATGVMVAAVPAAAVMELRQRVERERGTVVILRQAGPLECVAGAELDRWGTLPDTMALMREVKQMFDPKRILNAGRYLGGI
ncbi:MAG: FAD-linked oxidase C-terminal domain-containing protein, partial [Granulicella sp.]